jgi:hypothetical protein
MRVSQMVYVNMQQHDHVAQELLQPSTDSPPSSQATKSPNPRLTSTRSSQATISTDSTVGPAPSSQAAIPDDTGLNLVPTGVQYASLHSPALTADTNDMAVSARRGPVLGVWQHGSSKVTPLSRTAPHPLNKNDNTNPVTMSSRRGPVVGIWQHGSSKVTPLSRTVSHPLNRYNATKNMATSIPGVPPAGIFQHGSSKVIPLAPTDPRHPLNRRGVGEESLGRPLGGLGGDRLPPMLSPTLRLNDKNIMATSKWKGLPAALAAPQPALIIKPDPDSLIPSIETPEIIMNIPKQNH